MPNLVITLLTALFPTTESLLVELCDEDRAELSDLGVWISSS